MRVKIILCLIAAGYVFKKSNDAQMAIYAFIAALVERSVEVQLWSCSILVMKYIP